MAVAWSDSRIDGTRIASRINLRNLSSFYMTLLTGGQAKDILAYFDDEVKIL